MDTRTSSSITIGVDGRFLQDKLHGIGRYTFSLLTALRSCEGDFKLVVFVDPSLPNRRFPLHSLAAPGKVEIRHISIPLYRPQELWAWPSELRKYPVDVFHSPYFWFPPLTSRPLVLTYHDMILDRYPRYMTGRRYSLVYKFMSRWGLRKASRILTVSNATKDDIVEFTNTNPNKIITTHLGVDPIFKLVVSAEEHARVRAKYNLPASYVLAVGVRLPHKNFGRLASAFKRIAKDIPQSLVFVGSHDAHYPPDPSGAIARLKREGRAMEIPYVEEQDLAALYSMADLFVQPSRIEGFGFPIVEAMACGCPVACSNAGSLPEVAGAAAVLFDPLSEINMAQVIGQILASPNLRSKLSEDGIQRARQFTWQATAAKTLDVYRRAASHKTEGSTYQRAVQ